MCGRPPLASSRGNLLYGKLRIWQICARTMHPGCQELSSPCKLPLMGIADQLGLSFTPAPRRVWTVRELASAVRTHIERDYGDTWVEGEISNCRAHDSGHLYFTLKDESAQLSAVMFRSSARLLRFRPQNGMQVIVRGRMTVYEDRGQLQISAEYMEPKGSGALQIAFEQLKAKLQAEGLFDADRKKSVPAIPRRIGIITSPQAAALRDILNILQRRHRSASILIFPSQVQGEAAAPEICAGLRYFNASHNDANRNVDVIIIARGGGSAEDLAVFNDEALARSVAASAIPVISAVGHETDFTIIDFVADLRAPTPSAAAELVIRSRQEVEEQVASLHHRIEKALRYRLLISRQQLTELARHGAFARMMELIHRRQQRMDDLGYRLAQAQRGILDRQRRRFDGLAAAVRHYDLRRILSGIRKELEANTTAMASAMHAALRQKNLHLDKLQSEIEALSPLAILERGYALVFDSAGKLLKNASQVGPGEEISAKLAKGSVISTVKKIQSL